MASIFRHRDQWRAQVNQNGVRLSRSFDTKREAQLWAVEQEARAKRVRKALGMKFEDAIQKYLEEVSSKKDGAVWEVRRLTALLEMPYFKGMELGDIDSSHIAQWRDGRLKSVQGSTVVREANLLRNVFTVAKTEWKRIDQNPFEGVKMPKENEARHQVWPWQLIKRVLRAPRSGKTREVQDAFHIALRTGMRLGEVLQAPENFDRAKRIVSIKTKTEQMARIPIGRIAAKLLKRPPFTVGPNEASVLFSELCRELLIEGLTFHDSRATALTHLARKVDVMTLAKISRHKDLKMLLNVYYREKPESIAKRI